MTPEQIILNRIIAAVADEYGITPEELRAFDGSGKAKHYIHADAVRIVILVAHLCELPITDTAAALQCRTANITNRIRNAPMYTLWFARDLHRELTGDTDHA